MRASFLFLFLLALLCGLAGVCVAGDQARPSSSSRFDSAEGIVHPEDVALANDPAALERLSRELARDRDRDDDVTCYTVQSYQVKRQSRDSDVVEPVGYSTCQRASKFGVKKADEPDKGSAH
jgi:hypothetical protein